MFDFFQLWETLQSELIARFLAVFSVFHTKKFFLGWYSFKFLILKFPKSTKMDFFGMYYIQNGSKCDKWLCLVSEICNSALRSLKKVQKFSIWRQFGQNRAVCFVDRQIIGIYVAMFVSIFNAYFCTYHERICSIIVCLIKIYYMYRFWTKRLSI